MASPPMKTEQSFEFGELSPQDAMGSASESSYSPPGAVFGVSPPESSPRGRNNRRYVHKPTDWHSIFSALNLLHKHRAYI